jgi:ATP phosphoribosyltransferase regulatory subunit
LAVAGIVDVHLDLGHVGIYRGLAERAGLTDSQEADLFELLQRKDRSGVADFLAETELEREVAEMLAALLDFHGTEQILGIAGERLAPGGPKVRQALTELAAIHNALKPRFPALPINFDLAELRAYHYQTGVVFAAFVPGYGREIARGGRYDDIGKVFGCARPATGFSADLRVLGRLSALGSSGAIDEITVFAPASDDHDLDEAVRLLRAEGRVVIQELPGQVAEPAAVGCRYRLQKLGDKWTVLQL